MPTLSSWVEGFGELLVWAAQKWSLNQGYAYAQVVTQGNNLPAACIENVDTKSCRWNTSTTFG